MISFIQSSRILDRWEPSTASDRYFLSHDATQSSYFDQFIQSTTAWRLVDRAQSVNLGIGNCVRLRPTYRIYNHHGIALERVVVWWEDIKEYYLARYHTRELRNLGFTERKES